MKKNPRAALLVSPLARWYRASTSREARSEAYSRKEVSASSSSWRDSSSPVE
jgi:hypothetical protein